jgi:hypothetical protein
MMSSFEMELGMEMEYDGEQAGAGRSVWMTEVEE